MELQPFIESLLNRGMSSVELNIDSNADSQIDVEELYEWQKRANEPKRTSSSTLVVLGVRQVLTVHLGQVSFQRVRLQTP